MEDNWLFLWKITGYLINVSNKKYLICRSLRNVIVLELHEGTRHNSADSGPTSNLVCIKGLH